MIIQHTSRVFSSAVNNTHQQLAVGTEEGNAVIYRLTTGTPITSLPAQPEAIWSLDFSPDGHKLAIASFGAADTPDGAVQIWDTKTWSLTGNLGDPQYGGAWSLAFTADSDHLVIGHDDGDTRLWRVHDRQVLHIFSGSCEIPVVAVSPNSELIAHGCDETVQLFDLAKRTLVHRLPGHNDWIHRVAFSPTQPFLAVSSEGPLRIWNITTGTFWGTILPEIEIEAIAFSPDGELLACGCRDQNIRIVNVKNNRVVHVLEGHQAHIRTLQFVASEGRLISGGDDRTIRIWKLWG